MIGLTKLVAAGALVFAVSTPATAGIIFDNFGAGNTKDSGNGWTLSQGLPIGIDFDQGDAFTVAGGSFSLDSIELAISLISGQNRVFIEVYDDNVGAPGSLLESVLVDGQMGTFGDSTPPIVAAFSGDTVLEDGEQYWIIASTDDDSWAAWHLNSIGDLGPHAARMDSDPWGITTNARGAFRVTGELVPAPGVLSLLLLGPFGARRRRRR